MDNNDDLTIAARVKGWDIFAPDWAYLAQYPALELGSLCALSVGLHPYFAMPAWVLHVAIPHFNGTDSDEFYPLEDASEGTKQAALLHDFLQRVGIAAGNLAPLGTLPMAIGEANGERTMVKVADFVALADSLGWALPDEFPCQTAAGGDPVAPEGWQVGCSAKWPWGDYETELLQKLATAADRFWKLYDPADNTTAPTNKQVIDWLRKQGVAQRTAEVMATILRADGLPTGPRN